MRATALSRCLIELEVGELLGGLQRIAFVEAILGSFNKLIAPAFAAATVLTRVFLVDNLISLLRDLQSKEGVKEDNAHFGL